MQTTTLNSQSAKDFAAIMGTSGSLPLIDVFRPKTKVSNTPAAPVAANLPKGVMAAVEAADVLVASYTKLKIEILDRSDRALWEMLQQVYGFVQQIEATPTKRETRTELIKKIQQRDGQSMATNSSTEAVVVRYVFADQSRQSRNNYMIAMEKARALDIAMDGFADFLTQHGGVGKVVEMVFDYEEGEIQSAKEVADAIKEDKKNRSQLVRRLYSVMAHKAESQINYSGLISNWVPEKPKTTTDAKGKGSEKADPKFETGNFVFFVTVKNPETGKFHVVQGNVFDKAYEEQLLGTIAERMDVPTNELSMAVQGMERAIGFGDLAAKEQEVTTA
jgi:hypothetical protein